MKIPFIPIVHFFAVPMLLIIGPIISVIIYKTYKNQEELTIKNPLCPHCEKPLRLSSSKEEWPLNEACPECRVDFRAEIISP